MAFRVRPSPRENILKLVKERPGISRSEIATELGISYDSVRYWTERLVKEKLIESRTTWIIRPYLRRISYYPIVAVVYYRTQYAVMFYAAAPRTKTPDPIERCVI